MGEASLEAAVNFATWHNIGTRSRATEKPGQVGGGNSIWEPGLEGGNTGNFPTAYSKVLSFVCGAKETPAASDRQIVDVAGNKTLVHIEVRRSVIELRIVIIHEALVPRASGAHACGSRFIIQAPRPRYR